MLGLIGMLLLQVGFPPPGSHPGFTAPRPGGVVGAIFRPFAGFAPGGAMKRFSGFAAGDGGTMKPFPGGGAMPFGGPGAGDGGANPFAGFAPGGPMKPFGGPAAGDGGANPFAALAAFTPRQIPGGEQAGNPFQGAPLNNGFPQFPGFQMLTETLAPDGASFVYGLIGGRDTELGMALADLDPALRRQLKLPEGQGVLVTMIAPGGPADRIGLKPNDIVMSLGGKAVKTGSDLPAIMKEQGPDVAVPLAVVRHGKPVTLSVRVQTRYTLAPAAETKPSLYLGVQSVPVDAALRAHLSLPGDSGLVVNEVSQGSPAGMAGLKAGDILLKLADQPLPSPEALNAAIQATGGKTVKLALLREGKPLEVEVTPQTRPASEPEPDEMTTLHLGVASHGSQPWAQLFRSSAPMGSRVQPFFGQQMQIPGSFNPMSPPGSKDEIQALDRKVEELRRSIDELKQALGK